MFLKIGKVIVNQEYIQHCIIDEDAGRISVTFKSGAMFVFGKTSETFDPVGKVKGVTYLTANEFYSLQSFLKGDFCRNVA